MEPVPTYEPCARVNLAPGFFYKMGRSGPLDRELGHAKLYLNLAADEVRIESPHGGATLRRRPQADS